LDLRTRLKAQASLKETLFIINPESARGSTRRRWAEARAEFNRLGLQFTEHFTTRAGEATEVTRNALKNGVASVIAVGGDGTLSEIINGYIDNEGNPVNKSATVGILPSGTGSDFNRSLGLTGRSDAIDALTKRSASLLDAARIAYTDKDGAHASRSFINIASFGLGGDVSAFVNKWRNSWPRWVSGQARFAAAALRALERYRNVDVKLRLDDQSKIEIKSNLIIVANGRFGGAGMNLAPHAELNDGLFDVIITDRATRFDVIRELPRIRQGGYLRNLKVTEHRARQVSVLTDQPMAIDVDGEMVGHTPAHLTVLPKAIRFLAG
jgi:YegS/Rv2252/BmrU family lipid kinase